MKYYEILGGKENENIDVIHKKFKLLAKQWHPDRYVDKQKKDIAEQKFKEINNAYINIKKIHNSSNFYSNMENNEEFKNFTEKIINKGKIFNDIFNKAKNLDLKDFFNNFLGSMKKFRFVYDNIFSDNKSDDLLVNINVSLEDIYNKEDKIIDLELTKKCQKCYNNDLQFCMVCKNKIYHKVNKKIIFNCVDKIIVFSNEGNEENNKKVGDIIIKIHSKNHSNFKILNNYDIYYEINTNKLEDINTKFEYLDKKIYKFSATYPYRKRYIIKNKGLTYPYSDKIGDLVIKINYNPFDYNSVSDYSFN